MYTICYHSSPFISLSARLYSPRFFTPNSAAAWAAAAFRAIPPRRSSSTRAMARVEELRRGGMALKAAAAQAAAEFGVKKRGLYNRALREINGDE